MSNAVQANGAAGAAAGVEGAEGQEQQPGWPEMLKGLFWRFLIMYFIMSFFRGGGKQSATTTTDQDGKQVAMPAAPQSRNLFPRGTMMDIYVYISEYEKMRWSPGGGAREVTHKSNTESPPGAILALKVRDVEYGDWTGGLKGDGIFSTTVEIPFSNRVQNNGSIYAHAFFVAAGNSPNPLDGDRYLRTATATKSIRLNKYKKKRFVRKTSNLLTGTTEVDQATVVDLGKDMPVEIVSYIHPNLTVQIVDDHTPWTKGQVPQPLDQFIEFDKFGPDYYPIVFFNDYWNLNKDYWAINDTVTSFNLTISFNHLSMFKWQMYAAQSMKHQWMMGALTESLTDESDEDQDALKEAMLDTNPYLLGMTIVVTLLHSVFEFLAFKNDIQFWRSRDNLEGLSVRTVFWNVGQSLIVLLYVCDNETNFMVKISIGIGLVIELWKITKVTDVSFDFKKKFLGLFPRLLIEDKKTYSESETKTYDKLAFKYLSWLFFPLVASYSVYSLFYNEHKSWYSFVLSVAYGFLLTFGFIMMTPQLFINYKMKSVAHLPWRMMTYKALNTFIDDIFAFIIKMPMMYRIGCLRDDVIFFIFLYQKWLYPVDPKRVNEFGTSEELLKQMEQEKQQPQQHQLNGSATSVIDGDPVGDAGGDDAGDGDRANVAVSDKKND